MYLFSQFYNIIIIACQCNAYLALFQLAFYTEGKYLSNRYKIDPIVV